MYLVLTAMLALNVSSEILNAFDIIKKKLNDSAQNAEGAAQGSIEFMQAKIDEEIGKGQKQHELIKDSLNLIHTRTLDIIKFINASDTALLMLPGMLDKKTGEIGKKDESELNHQFLMGKGQDEANGGRGAGRAKALRDTINAYYDWLAAVYNIGRPDSVVWKKESYALNDPDPSKSNDGHGGLKQTWERYTFNGPIVANRAMMEVLKQDVYQRENRLFNAYAARLGIKQEQLEKQKPKDPPPPPVVKPPDPAEAAIGTPMAIIAPYSTVVPAGFPYKAKIYLGLKNDNTASFTTTSGTIVNEPDGQGAMLTILPNINLGGKAEVEQSYTISGNVKMAKGGNKPVTATGKFIVRKPEIVVTSASVQTLYRQCGNMINIDVPALGDLYNPVCTASDADIQQSKDSKKKFLIVPRGNKCVVSVSSLTNGQTMKIGDVTYNVIDPPKPSIELMINGQRASSSTQVSRGSQVNIKIVPDPEFKNLLPNDAKYEVTRVDAFVQCGLTPPRNVGGADLGGRDAAEGLKFPVPGDAFQCQSGSKLFFEVKDILRKNFQGKKITDNRFTLYEKAITVLTK